MLEQFSEQIRLCHKRAADAKERADATNDLVIKAEYFAQEKRWLTLARSYGFTESLEDFTAANSEQRRTFDERLQQSRALVAEVSENLGPGDTLHEVSTLLIQEGNLDSLYNRILDAATNLMSSDMASIQMLDPERNQLRLLGWKGFHPQSASFWEWVYLDSASTCGIALSAGSRVVVSDVETCDFMAGTADLDEYRRSNIRAVQSTPLVSRSGQLLGMISTHWREQHHPTERALRRLDVLARQAADLIERGKAEAALRESNEQLLRLASIVESSNDAILTESLDGIITSWNKSAVQLFGYTAQEVIGKPITVYIPLERHNEEPTILARIKNGERIDHYETVRQHKDRRLIDISLTVSPIRNAQGKIVGASKIARDITDRKLAEARIAADVRDMGQLIQLSNRLVREGSDFNGNLNAVLDTAIAITGAVKGSLRLLDPTKAVLILAAQRGFGEAYLNLFAAMPVEDSTYAAAMQSGERSIIEDMRESEILAGHPSKEVLLDAGVRAVTSTPLLASTENLLGMISTHFDKPHRPDERTLRLMDLLARQTADYLERKRSDETEKTLLREIHHRSNNLLAVIQSIANRSLSGSRTLAEAKEAFETRLHALARTNQQLIKSNWSGVSLSELVCLELKPFAERAIVDGINVMLSPQQAQNFSLALHELATNAAKYGALSNGSGKVGVSWTLTTQDNNNKLKFKWQESGGPPVIVPTCHGFGTTLIKGTFSDVRIEYAVEGLSCEIDVPLSQDGHDQAETH
jgi:PAS domain S-box-containing protein